MAFAQIPSAQAHVLTVNRIDVEADVSRGIHSFSLVGLPDKAVEEARDRISSAIKYSGFPSPRHSNQKVVISLAPAHIPKSGAHFDLAMAIAYLKATDNIKGVTDRTLFLGELSLDGSLRSIRGTLPLVAYARNNGFDSVFIPRENTSEAGLVEGINIYGASCLKEIVEHINGTTNIVPHIRNQIIPPPRKITVSMDDIRGQAVAKRALLIAASGGHNSALWGPPGTGKTMLAKAFYSILPELSFEEALEVTSIYSIAGLLQEPLMHSPPFRAPHHTASYSALVGGGAIPKPGEITLAHKGVLFLDELPEFDNETLETLREPLEERVITISRARGSGVFPADFVLIAAMNPCPCGNRGVQHKECTCTPATIERYRKKLSGPITDRIGMWTEVSSVEYEKLLDKAPTDTSTTTRQLMDTVIRARNKQYTRSLEHQRIKILNGRIRNIPYWFEISDTARQTLNLAAKRLSISGRSYRNIVTIARTIADLEDSTPVQEHHILEALQYRAERIF